MVPRPPAGLPPQPTWVLGCNCQSRPHCPSQGQFLALRPSGRPSAYTPAPGVLHCRAMGGRLRTTNPLAPSSKFPKGQDGEQGRWRSYQSGGSGCSSQAGLRDSSQREIQEGKNSTR